MKKYQLAIIGGGPAGYTAAEKAGKAGLSVVLFEKKALGGVCLNEGCVPTKTLLYSAKMYDIAKESKRFGVTFNESQYDFKRIISRKNKVVRKLILGVKAKMEKANVECVMGEAQVIDEQTIECNEIQYQFEKLIVCTGSSSFVPPIKGLNETVFWTHNEALTTQEVPESLIIIGGGVIGIEFASFYNSLGTEVTVIELMDEILPGMDKDLSALLRTEYTKKGINFILQTKVEEIKEKEDKIAVAITINVGSQTLIADKVLLSTGRKPNTHKLNWTTLDITFNEKGLLTTNKHLQSSNPNVYICGDVNGVSLLAHTAIREAEVAVNHILGIEDEMNYKAIPAVVYTNPEYATVGQTEEELTAADIDYTSTSLPLSYSGRFVAENEGFNGLCKVLIDAKQDTILGVHILGNPASEIITSAAMAIELKLTTKEWGKIVFPHPTVNEIFKEFL